MIELIFLIYLLYLILDYILVDFDLTAPSFIFCAMYSFCFGCALINRNQWGLDHMNVITILIFVIGGLIFIAIDIFCKKIFYCPTKQTTELHMIDFNKKMILFICILCILITIIYLMQIIDKVSYYISTHSFSQILAAYRNLAGYRLVISMPGWLKQVSKLITIFAYLFLLVFINNVVVSKKVKTNLPYIFPVLIYIIWSFATSNRLNFLNVLGTSVIFYNLLQEKKNASIKNSVKRLLKAIPIFLGALLFFYLIRVLIGRIGAANIDIITYLSKYVAGSIKLFDIFIDNPVHSNIWGKETFISFINNLSELNIIDIPQYVGHKEFRSYNGIELGNIYTAYRCWYADFGFAGTVILHAIFAAFYSVFYYKVKSTDYTNHKKVFPLIMYGYVSSGLYLHPIADGFYGNLICIGFVIYCIGFFIVYLFVFKKIRLKI